MNIQVLDCPVDVTRGTDLNSTAKSLNPKLILELQPTESEMELAV